MLSQKFYSKILLFGEYSIIKGGNGLAMPFCDFYGQLELAGSTANVEQGLRLNSFCNYLMGSKSLSESLNLELLKEDIAKGLWFNSNIPLGHGVGSSGALCAALYARYAKDFEVKEIYSSEELRFLQDQMALMESYYHGTSSGLDCLISLVNKCALIYERNKVKVVHRPDLKEFGHFYLYETHLIRKTSPLVHQFLADYDSDENFRAEFERFVELSDALIESTLNYDIDSFQQKFYDISKLQYLNFSNMIPSTIQKFWLEGLESKEHFVKFCGAGGGGFFIVYSMNKLESTELHALK